MQNNPILDFPWLYDHAWECAITIALLLAYLLADRFGSPRIEEKSDDSHFSAGAAAKAINIARVLFALVGIPILLIIWGVNFGSIVVFATTTVTLIGVALFASWSMLSNITAYFVLLLHPAFRRGNFVRIIDADNYVEGYISDLSLFNAKLITESREIIMYPNNLLLTRPFLINPRDRLSGIGKLTPPPNKAGSDQDAK
ncbi:MAG: mechanosensitive ion channel domain-containing protein [Gammaproteobacteria bacterium]